MQRGLQIEDLKTVPLEPEPSASDKALEDFLRQATGGVGTSTSGAPVNDLNSLVKKKKKPTTSSTPIPAAAAVKKEEAPIEGNVEEEGKGKRKAEEEVGKEGSEEKKVKVSSE